MDIEAIRGHCLQFAHATENVQWGADLCFKVDGKLFAVAALEMVPQRLSFKCTPENFALLCERPDIIPAPYMARAQWVSLLRLDALLDHELRDLVAESYRLVWERLPQRRREELAGSAGGKTKAASHAGKPKPAARRVSAKPKRAGAKRKG